MWWTGQNIDKPIKAKDGTLWNFLVYKDYNDTISIFKIFFWDEKKEVTGILELKDDSINVKKIKDKIRKLAKDKKFRDNHLCELKFPIKKYY